jgi:FkbM family methyltransferase
MFINSILVEKINRLVKKLLLRGGELSYSQAGEDMILNCIFLSKNKGVYIDVGANHPTKASNTYFFYKRGWTGINIDALPNAIKLFHKQRRRDINIQSGISDIEGSFNFYMFKESSYNTFNEKFIDEIIKISPLLEIKKILVQPLYSVLSQYNITSIDFMSVDVEGLDLNVLKSNDWGNFRPKIVLVEDFNNNNEIKNSTIYDFMGTLGYDFFCRTVTNTFYIEHDFYKERFIQKNK